MHPASDNRSDAPSPAESGSGRTRLRRSVLFMPGSNPRAMAKARTLPCDAVVLDLEDSVAPDIKPAARERVVAEIGAGGFGRREVVIRVNGPDTPWFDEDLAAAAMSGADAILISKVADPATILDAGARLDGHGAPASLRLWAMLESAAAVLRADAIAATAGQGRLALLVPGTNDLSKDILRRLDVDREVMRPYLALLIAAARAHGLTILDSVFNGIGDAAGFEAECREGRRLGFDGKTLIHPSQIEAANRIYAPTAEEIAEATAILAAFDLPANSDKGAIALGGRMVERLHLDIAHRIVDDARAAAAAAAAEGESR